MKFTILAVVAALGITLMADEAQALGRRKKGCGGSSGGCSSGAAVTGCSAGTSTFTTATYATATAPSCGPCQTAYQGWPMTQSYISPTQTMPQMIQPTQTIPQGYIPSQQIIPQQQIPPTSNSLIK